MNDQKIRSAIFTDPPHNKNYNSISLSNKEFLKLFEQLKEPIVFKYNIDYTYPDKKNNWYYIVKEGFYFITNGFKTENIQEFFDKVRIATENDFNNLNNYFHAQELDIENRNDYYGFKESEFYETDRDYGNLNNLNKYRFTEFLKARTMGFSSRRDYEDAEELGIPDCKSFENFIESGFMDEYGNSKSRKKDYSRYLEAKEKGFTNVNDFKLAQELQIENSEKLERFKNSGFFEADSYPKASEYSDFQKAQALGFTNREDFSNAESLGFENYSEYNKYLESGCETVEEYKFTIEFPPIFKEMTQKIEEISQDMESYLKESKYGDFVRLQYLKAEKVAELAFMNIFKQQLSEDLKLEDIIKQIKDKTKITIAEQKKLVYWRRMRNEVVHDHLKLEKETAEKAQEFFDNFHKKIEKLMKK